MGARSRRLPRASPSSTRSSTSRSRCRRSSPGSRCSRSTAQRRRSTSTSCSRKTAVVLCLMFVTLPFVVRTVQPWRLDQARSRGGAGRPFARRFAANDVPPDRPSNILPSILSGVALAFAKAVGEFGSLVIITGNIPFDTHRARRGRGRPPLRAESARRRRSVRGMDDIRGVADEERPCRTGVIELHADDIDSADEGADAAQGRGRHPPAVLRAGRAPSPRPMRAPRACCIGRAIPAMRARWCSATATAICG